MPAARSYVAGNFQLVLDGVDCGFLKSVDGGAPVAEVITEARDYLREPTRLEFPNLKITMIESSDKSWFDWFDDFVIEGNSDESKERKGSISLLSANLADELLRIDLFNLGIFKIGKDKAEANSDRVTTGTAHLYCEGIQLHAGGARRPSRRRGREACGGRRAGGR